MCKKVKHHTTHGATKHIISLRAKGKAFGLKMGIYHCTDCNAYHVTSRIYKACIVIL